MRKLIVIGYSGHAYVVIDSAVKAGFSIAGYTENETLDTNPYNLNYLGNERKEDFEYWGKKYQFIIGIGSNKIRLELLDLLESKGEDLVSVTHPSAYISTTATMGVGTFIACGVHVNPLAEIGDGVILNTGSIVEHECKIGKAAHIAPGAVLAGNVQVGGGSLIGANAVIKEGVKIGNNVIIGAGTVVLNSVPDGSKVVGNPGRTL